MPTSPFKNLIYCITLPFLSPSVNGQMKHTFSRKALVYPEEYERLLAKHHTMGASLLLTDGHEKAIVHTSIKEPAHHAGPDTIYRVASITKMATALVTLMLQDDGCFTLDTPIAEVLPDGHASPALQGVTIRHLLSHTSGLRDTPRMEAALRHRQSFHDVCRAEDIRIAQPGQMMHYCNFGFGLLGCMLEHISHLSLEALFHQRLFAPLGMRATLDASTLDESLIMPICRVLPYRSGQEVTIPPLGHVPLSSPDPLHHFAHTAGAMYTDCTSLSRMLTLIVQGGVYKDKRLLSASSVAQMTTPHASAENRIYGLGLVLLSRSDLSAHRLLGHQGFAYGCVDGAFVEEGTGRQVIFLNGGASEARTGRLGLVNRDILRWALTKELPAWR